MASRIKFVIKYSPINHSFYQGEGRGNEELLTGILREEWGYEGLVVTDWGNWAEHYREALAGNNVRMPHGSLRRLQKAMELGLISRNTLIENARQVLQWMMRLE